MNGDPDRSAIPVRLARSLAGLIAGTVLGLAVSLGVVVFQARFQHHYLQSTDDIISWRAVPIPAGMVLGAVGGWSAPMLLAGGSLGGLVGGAAGALTGAVVGDATSDARSGPWAGGIIGSALGVLLGAGAGLFLGRAWWTRRRAAATRRSRPGRTAASMLLLLPWLMIACGSDAPPLPHVPAAPPADGDDIEGVFFFSGDPGKANHIKFPILPKLAREVERWSERLDRDCSVVVVALGDIIYPDGMHDPGTEGFTTDSIESQIDVVRGAQARERGARGFGCGDGLGAVHGRWRGGIRNHLLHATAGGSRLPVTSALPRGTSLWPEWSLQPRHRTMRIMTVNS